MGSVCGSSIQCGIAGGMLSRQRSAIWLCGGWERKMLSSLGHGEVADRYQSNRAEEHRRQVRKTEQGTERSQRQENA